MPVETPKCYDEKGLSLAAISILTVSGYLPAKARACWDTTKTPHQPVVVTHGSAGTSCSSPRRNILKPLLLGFGEM